MRSGYINTFRRTSAMWFVSWGLVLFGSLNSANQFSTTRMVDWARSAKGRGSVRLPIPGMYFGVQYR